MSAKFDWETDEDERRLPDSLWDDSAVSVDEPLAVRRWKWRMPALALVLLLITGAVIWWRIDRLIDANMQSVVTDVVASHNLMQRTVADGDEEVFRSVLSGRMPAWTVEEVALFEEGLIFDRHPFGLSPVEGSLPILLAAPDDETPVQDPIYTIDLSPDLNEATVVVEHPYVTDLTGETVTLQQTAMFRRGDSRWLLAPPLDEYWGDWVTHEGEYLSLIYPQRDAAIAAQLAEDLDAEIGRMCETLEDINCSADLYLTVRLQKEPRSLSAMAIPLGPLQRAREDGDILELPTPTLVGLPVEGDEEQRAAGYAALLNGYARHVLSAAIVQAVGWHCCDDALLFSLLLEYQMAELGLKTWPVTPADHQRILDGRIRMSDPINYLRARFRTEVDSETLWVLRTAIDFLLKGGSGSTAADMQRVLDRTNTFSQFIDSVWDTAGEGNSNPLPENIDIAWWLFAMDYAEDTGDPPPPPSGETLYLSCSLVDGNQTPSTSSMYRYLSDEDSWEATYNVQGMIWMSTLGDPETLLVQEFALEGQSFRTNTWHNGQISRIDVAELQTSTFSFGETDPSGDILVAYVIEQDTGDLRGLLIDLASCDERCAMAEMPGHPMWSPNGQSAVYMGGSDFFPNDLLVAGNNRYILLESPNQTHELPLTIGPGNVTAGSPELLPVGVGRSPFWLDDRTFGFVRTVKAGDNVVPGETEIVMASLEDPTPLNLVSSTELFAQLTEDIPPRGSSNLSIGFVAAHPDQPDQLFIVALDDLLERAYLIVYDLDSGLAEVRMQLLFTLNLSLSFSPNGRYVVMTGQDNNATSPGNDASVLLMHNIEENHTTPFIPRTPFVLPAVVHDWSEDSRWLAIIMEDNLIGMVAPDSGYTRLLPRAVGSCTSVAWLRE